MKELTLKKTLSLVLVALVLVTSLGFAPAVYADDADIEEADIEVKGAGELTAEGDGFALLAGRGIIRLKGNGLLWIKDVAGDATIRVTGQGQKTEFPDGWIQYAGFRGTANVKGSKIRVIISGVDIDLFAKGRGRVFLWGHGSYEINGTSGRWETERLGKRVVLASEDVLSQLNEKKADIGDRVRERPGRVQDGFGSTDASPIQ